jgi:hypothetical protein
MKSDFSTRRRLEEMSLAKLRKIVNDIRMSVAIKTTIQMLGGTLAVARHFAVTPQTVSSWIKRGNVPSKYWPSLLALARSRGISLPLERLTGIDDPDTRKAFAINSENRNVTV